MRRLFEEFHKNSEDTTEIAESLNGDNEKTLLLLAVIFSYRWKLYHRISRKDFFVVSNS